MKYRDFVYCWAAVLLKKIPQDYSLGPSHYQSVWPCREPAIRPGWTPACSHPKAAGIGSSTPAALSAGEAVTYGDVGMNRGCEVQSHFLELFPNVWLLGCFCDSHSFTRVKTPCISWGHLDWSQGKSPGVTLRATPCNFRGFNHAATWPYSTARGKSAAVKETFVI